MQKNKHSIIALAALVCLIGLFVYTHLAKTNYLTATKLLRFSYVVKNESARLVEESRFTAVLPMQIKGIQTIESITSSYEYQISKSDEQLIEFPLKNITPYSSKIIDLTLVVNLSNKPKSDSAKPAEYLASQKYIEMDSTEIKELAAQLKGNTATETANNIHQWLVNNVTPSSYTADSKGAAYLINNKTGDCTEFMYAFIALARANGVPARGISGFWIPGDSSLINAADYHDWAEFYDGDRWVLVDSSKNIFDESYSNYIYVNFLNHDERSNRYSSDSKYLTISN
ncbi:MAG: hypothetical protein B0W54_15125 [Cellvibrio sp. 79]|nr:MAG: hypothetical protein B0W54_15125 [Cellvibrio sp. 79]